MPDATTRCRPLLQVDAACRLLERMMHIVAAEGWHGLLGQLLPKLIACQRLVGHVMLPYTCMRMLALPHEACAPEDRLAVFRELLAVTAQPSSRQNDMLVAAIQLQTLQAIQVGSWGGCSGCRCHRCVVGEEGSGRQQGLLGRQPRALSCLRCIAAGETQPAAPAPCHCSTACNLAQP